MKQLVCIVVVCTLLGFGGSAVGTSYPAEQPMPDSMPGAGASLAAAFANVVYFPVRFAVTVVTAGLGGFTGWMTGGYEPAANAVWKSTDGQPFLLPEIIEGREPLRIGDAELGGTRSSLANPPAVRAAPAPYPEMY